MAETIGFLSVRHHEEHGYFGGYLILNLLARPLEFHCTMPVKPARAQQVLYGPTIDDFICGEQIAKALVTKAKLKPRIVLTDCAPVLAVSIVSDIEAVMLDLETQPTSEASLLERPHSQAACNRLELRDQAFLLPSQSKVTESQLDKLLSQLAPNFELAEPFQRIEEALLEAHPIAKAA